MAACMHFRIAGVDYQVSYPPGVIAHAPNAIQSAFVSHHPPNNAVIRVDMVAGGPPDPGFWQALVSYGPAWSIRQNGAQRCVCIGKPFGSPPAGLFTCWQADASRATVYCGPEYLTVRGDDVEMGYAAGYPVDQLLFIY